MRAPDKPARPAHAPHPVYARPRDRWRTLMRHRMAARLGVGAGILIVLIGWALWQYEPNRNRPDFAWVTGTLLTGAGTVVLFGVYLAIVRLVRWYRYG